MYSFFNKFIYKFNLMYFVTFVKMMEAPAASRAVGGLQRLSSSSGVSSTSVSHGMSSVRSMSVASISSEGSSESHGVEQEEISALTHDVRAFKEALGYLRTIFQHSERGRPIRLVISKISSNYEGIKLKQFFCSCTLIIAKKAKKIYLKL
jgi:hypothetical protein